MGHGVPDGDGSSVGSSKKEWIESHCKYISVAKGRCVLKKVLVGDALEIG